jgi:hypothetical protein
MACAGECARKVTTTASVGVGRDRGVAVGNAAEPGSTPWVAASPASTVGSRGRVRVRLGQGVPEVVKGAVSPSGATASATYPTTARL